MNIIERARVALRDWLCRSTAEEAAEYAAARAEFEELLTGKCSPASATFVRYSPLQEADEPPRETTAPTADQYGLQVAARNLRGAGARDQAPRDQDAFR